MKKKINFAPNQSKHGNPSGHNDQLGVVKDIPIGAYSGIGFYASSPVWTPHLGDKLGDHLGDFDDEIWDLKGAGIFSIYLLG
ncbi:hypothetical protein AVEN_272962-1, partial [Araneus ventricosus]